jgi:GntR family transcriptional regulator
MRFQIEKRSPVAVHTQIKERIKIALSLGELRPGDTLPSIRDLESELGIGRAIIRRVYLELAEQGLLDIKRGRRITVSGSVVPVANNGELRRKLDEMVEEVLNRLTQSSLNEVSFVRYLLVKVLDQARSQYRLLYVDRSRTVASKSAAQIAKAWQLPIHGTSLDELPRLLKQHGNCVRDILTSYYRLDQVLALVRESDFSQTSKVIPVQWVFSNKMTRRIRLLNSGSKVLLLPDPEEYLQNGKAFADAYHEAFRSLQIRFVVRPATNEGVVIAALNSPEYDLVVVSNAVWEQLPEKICRSAKLLRPSFEFNKSSLEEARCRAGILR